MAAKKKKADPSMVRGGSAGTQQKTKVVNSYIPYGDNTVKQSKRNWQVEVEGEMKSDARKVATGAAIRKSDDRKAAKKKK